jgi:hypothetical protein
MIEPCSINFPQFTFISSLRGRIKLMIFYSPQLCSFLDNTTVFFLMYYLRQALLHCKFFDSPFAIAKNQFDQIHPGL